MDASYESSSAIAIKLAGAQTEAGEGFTVDDQAVTITSAGDIYGQRFFDRWSVENQRRQKPKVHLIFAGSKYHEC